MSPSINRRPINDPTRPGAEKGWHGCVTPVPPHWKRNVDERAREAAESARSPHAEGEYAPQAIDAAAKMLADDYAYLSQWPVTPETWRQMARRAFEAANEVVAKGERHG